MRRMYTFAGVRVTSIDDIIDGGEYVAVSQSQPLIKAAYNCENIGVGPSVRKFVILHDC